MKTNPMKHFVFAALCATSLNALSDDFEKFYGLADFRYVKSNVDVRRCGDEIWESGNFFKNKDSKLLFNPNEDTLTVKLKNAAYPWIPESNWLGRARMFGQVGIFADITLKGDATAAPGGRSVPGRLVFYNDNYARGQVRISDVNTNIFGPVLYPGGGVSLKLTLLEFDHDDKDNLADGLLKGIADLGVQASAGVPAYLQGPLGQLSQTALNFAKAKDDIFGKNHVVFDDRNGNDNPMTTPLRTGDVVIIRASNRNVSVDWNNICYDPTTAVVSPDEDKINSLAADKKKDLKQKIDTIRQEYGYTVISFVKNAGADAGRIVDAFTYEQFIQEKEKSVKAAGTVLAAAEITEALRQKVVSRELDKQLAVIAADANAVPELERFEAGRKVAQVVYVSSPKLGSESTGKVLEKLGGTGGDSACSYLRKEIIGPNEMMRLWVQLERLQPGIKGRVNDLLKGSAPESCYAAFEKIDEIRKEVQKPRQAQ